MNYFDKVYIEEMGFYGDEEMAKEFKGAVSVEQVKEFKQILENNDLMKKNEKLCDFHVTTLDDVLMVMKRDKVDFKQAVDYMIQEYNGQLKEIAGVLN
ncbi:gp601 [Bacillus phage G]|uniref:Gp601 n=1 Tax=Bacillus phage G TaxID=2884420 RepID=G3MAY1_9CAUD|nr:gp601 [Bacillus phage G]AEO93846.1 gp601 [Bacillus phage G]